MAKDWTNLVVYVIRSRGTVVYVGQGSPGRAKEWRFKSRWSKLGLEETPEILILAEGLTRPQALRLESEFIEHLKPLKNKAKFDSAGGLVPHNKGKLGGKGGRPKGIPLTEGQKRHLSEKMKGRSTAWLRGRKPWNAGLTRDDPRVAKGYASYDLEKRREAAMKTWQKRRGL